MTSIAALGPLRLSFLALTPVCVLTGFATATRAIGSIPWGQALLVLSGALCAHASVNAFNEYFDFRSGLDLRTARTPFSGGSGALPAHPELAPLALLVAVGALAVTIAIGVYFLRTRGAILLPFGLVGVAVIVTYTSWLTRHPALCLIAPGLGFGPLMVLGTHVALTGHPGSLAAAASLVPGLLASGLLLLNQFPDVEADRSVGRRHIVIEWGRRRSARLFVVLLGSTYVCAFAISVRCALGPVAICVGLTLPLAWKLGRGVLAHAEVVPLLVPFMRLNVLLCLAVPVLLSLGLWLARTAGA